MSRLVKIVDNKYVQIEEYKNPNICFNTNEYDNFEDYCTLRETFDPFEIFYENQELKEQLENYKKLGFEHLQDKNNNLETQQKEFIKYLEDEIKLHKNDIQTFSKDYNVYFSLINDLRVSKAKIEEILKKYKRIIGENDV